MNRSSARGIVFGTLKDVGVEPQSVTRKTKLSSVLDDEIVVDFVRRFNQRLPAGKRLDTSHLYFTIGQLVTMAGSTLPGKKGPTKPWPTPPVPVEE
ncbi:MAG TPA: hypothetical protein VGD79_03000 [Thermoanaerobaculia bacterium]|jgi:hypothetical protein